MRLTRVFVAGPLSTGTRAALSPEAAGHLTRVLRLGEGDDCVLFNGEGGEFAARIASIGKRVTLVDVGTHDPVERESPLRILLLQALARGERMDLIVQKATELGVAAIRPVHTLHSGVKLDADQAARKVEHWRGIAISACEQCQRNRVPDLLQPVSLVQTLGDLLPGPKLVLSLDTAGASPRSLASLATAREGEWISVVVGPEGGLAQKEEELLREAGFAPVSLGPRVLRTETAAIALLAALGTLAGDLA